jgi:hypothetical protein
MEAFEQEKILAQQEGYICRYDDYGEDDYDDEPIAARLVRRDATTLRIDQPGHNSNAAAPHVLKMPQAENSKANVRLSRNDDDESFGSGIV